MGAVLHSGDADGRDHRPLGRRRRGLAGAAGERHAPRGRGTLVDGAGDSPRRCAHPSPQGSAAHRRRAARRHVSPGAHRGAVSRARPAVPQSATRAIRARDRRRARRLRVTRHRSYGHRGAHVGTRRLAALVRHVGGRHGARRECAPGNQPPGAIRLHAWPHGRRARQRVRARHEVARRDLRASPQRPRDGRALLAPRVSPLAALRHRAPRGRGVAHDRARDRTLRDRRADRHVLERRSRQLDRHGTVRTARRR